MKYLKSNAGFTLVELIVSITIMTIILPAIVAGLVYTTNMFMDIRALADISVLSSDLERTIKRELTVATSTSIASDGSSITYGKYGSKDNTLQTAGVTTSNGNSISIMQMNGINIYDAAHYNGTSVNIVFSPAADNMINVSMTFSGTTTRTVSFYVKPLIFN